MNVGFQCPDNGVPIIGEWEELSGELTFKLEDEERDLGYCPQEEIEEAKKWCDRNRGRIFRYECDVNDYLHSVGVKERLEVRN